MTYFPEECLFDSVGFQNRCYVFNTEINRPSSTYYWEGNERVCQDLAMEMVVVETEVTLDGFVNHPIIHILLLVLTGGEHIFI